MPPLDMFSEPAWQRLTWTLLHFLWQGLAVAAVLVTVLWLFRVRQARIRYAVSLVAMLVMVACPLVTFAVMQVGANASVEVGRRTAEVEWEAPQRRPTIVGQERSTPDEAVVVYQPVELGEDVFLHDPQPVDRPVAAQAAAPGRSLRLSGYARTVQPYLMLGWIAGVSLLGARLLLAQVGVQWLRRRRRPISAELVSCVARLRKRLGLRSVPRVSGCERIGEAIVVGLLRPMVLLPACWLVEMTPEVLEAVVAHELAHVRRWDLWVNLFQRLVETLLFYQPAVWWVSRRVRLEREMCCDELAVGATGQRMAYATALSQAARKRAARTKPLLGAAMGGTEMTLLSRVRYVLGLSPGRERARWWPVGLLALLVPLGVWFGSIGTGLTGEGERQVQERPLASAKKGSPKGEFSANLQQSAHLAVTLELTTLHWRSLESNERFRPLITSLIDGLQKGQTSNPWKVSFLPLNPPGPERAQLDQFEVKALREIRAGKAEVWQARADGEARYMRAIRATDSTCVTCHSATGRPATPNDHPLKEDDILGVASLRLAPQKEDASPNQQAVPAAGKTYRVRPFDLLTIDVVNTRFVLDHPIDQTYFVDPAGQVALGPVYGRVRLGGLTLQEAEGAIEEQLQKVIREPKVQVTWAGPVTRWHSVTVQQTSDRITPPTFLRLQVTGTLTDQPIDGEFLVDPNGQIALGPTYGTANVKGLTVEQAERAIAAHLRQFLKEPKVSASLISDRRIVAHHVLPTSPDRITTADLLDVQVLGTLPDEPISGTYLLEASGEVALGPAYGRVRLQGLTLPEAEATIEKRLKRVLREPKAFVSLAGWKSGQEKTTEERLRIRDLEEDVRRLRIVIQRLGGSARNGH